MKHTRAKLRLVHKLLLAHIVVLLLVQFFVRIHNPMALPAFVDEGSHLARAQVVYKENPVETSHGKLLFYFWLGLFSPGEYNALVIGRWAVALFSLIGSAAMAAVARQLFGRQAMLPALAFYALAPYTVFFERMALADSFAGALATLVVWQSIRLARRPTGGRGVVLGLLVALAPMAKLTTSLIVFVPLLAILLFTAGGKPHPPPHRREGKEAVRRLSFYRMERRGRLKVAWGEVNRLWKHYHRALIVAALVCGIVWLPVLGTALWLRVVEHRDAILIDTYLVNTEQETSALLQRLADVITTSFTLLSEAMTLALVGFAMQLLWKRPVKAILVLGWLVLIWGPNILLVREIQPRYLMAGLPALAVIFGGGVAVGLEALVRVLRPLAWIGVPRRTVASIGIASIMSAWMVTYAFPFAYYASHDPVQLRLTEKDTYNYFTGMYNGWGISLALDFLNHQGEQINDQIPVVAVMRNCGVYALHITSYFDGRCMDWHSFDEDEIAHNIALWTPLLESIQEWPFVYVITEYLPLDAPPTDDSLHWELVDHFERPHGGLRTVSIWRVTPVGPV